MQNGGPQKGRRQYVLYACIPILQEAPSGWTLALVDTPGFGEANVGHITALTDRLFSTSTAYLYIMDSGIMKDAVDAKNIERLFEHDKGDIYIPGIMLTRGGGRGGAGGGDRPPNIPVGGPRPPNKIGAMTTECVLLLHALDAFQNVLYTTTRIYMRADYSSSSPSLYCKLRNACAYVLASRSHTFSGEGVAPRGYMWYRQSRPPNSELLPPPLLTYDKNLLCRSVR